ncbi:hypothetical protein GBA52_022905 [Prunus armeniaca]|nr:hypothetical protein GBA52_022905 [Prunus armeniaca]
MEEIAQAVAVPYRLGNLIHEESAVKIQMEMTGLKLIANSPCESFSCGNESYRSNGPHDENRVEATVSNMLAGYVGDQISNENIDWGSKEYKKFRPSCEVGNGSSTTSDASTSLISATRDKKICRTSLQSESFRFGSSTPMGLHIYLWKETGDGR